MDDVNCCCAAGSKKGHGYVYVLKDRGEGETIFKIGQAEDVYVRLDQIQKQRGGVHKKAVLLAFFEAAEANLAETAAQKAVTVKLNMRKCPYYGVATDWFSKNRNVSKNTLLETVEEAVNWCNEQDPGVVYILRDTKKKLFKICWVQRATNMDDQGHTILEFFHVLKVRLAIGAVQNAVENDLGLSKENDWYENPRRKTNAEVVKRVAREVKAHNDKVLAFWS